MNKKIIPILFITTATLLISACGGPQMAKNIASQMHSLNFDYEKAVAKKVEAEVTFYNNQRQVLRDALSGSTLINIPKQNDEGSVRKTIAYGLIRTDIERNAKLLASTLTHSTNIPNISTPLITFLENGVENGQKAYQLANQRQQQLKIDLLAGLAQIDQQFGRLKTIRRELDKLKNNPSMEENLKQYFIIGQAVTAQLDSQNSLNK